MSIRGFHRARARRAERASRRANALARRGRLLAGATLGATTLLAANAQAATYVVNTTADSNDGSCANPCSLRDAINAANGDGSTDTITFDPSVTGTINLGSPLSISTPHGLTIQGPGASSLSISGQGSTGIFEITSTGGPGDPFSTTPNVISGLTLTDGSSATPGGAVVSVTEDPLVVSDDVITHSTSTNSNSDGGGGGVFATGPLTIKSSMISGNSAAHGGGVEVNPSYAYGGGSPPFKYGLPLVIEGSTISHNHALSTGPGFGPGLGGGGGVAAYGSQLVVRNSTISGNTSVESGGGIDDLSKYGMKVSHSRLTGNTASYAGGGIMDEGWLAGKKYDPAEISTSTISGNSSEFGGGVAIAQYAYNASQSGGAPGEPVTIEASTISRNHAVAAGKHGINKSFGGGIGVFGELESPFRLVDSTVSGNTADRGGGISLGDSYLPLFGTDPTTGQSGSVTVENSTIAGNTANLFHSGGGIYLTGYSNKSNPTERSGTASLESTIVAGNRSKGVPNDLQRATGSKTGGFTGGFDLVQAPPSAPLKGKHMILGKNPQLGPLANNGGPTETVKPAGTSPAIDQGHAGPGVPTDQRGNARTVDTAISNPPTGDGTDIGSFELSTGQVVPPPQPQFSARIGQALLGGSTTPLLIDGVTRVVCHVKVGLLSACAIEVTSNGHTLASGGVPADKATKRLTTTVGSSRTVQRYLLEHYPLGITARANAVGLAAGPASAMGPVKLLGGPSITLELGTGTAGFSHKVDGEINQAAKLVAGAKSLTLTSQSSTQAAAVAKRLTNDGVTGKIQIRVSKHEPGHHITISFRY